MYLAAAVVSSADKAAAGWCFAQRGGMTMRTLIVAALLSVATSVSPRLWADDEAKNKGIGGGLAERIQDLNLTADQEDKIADIRKECQPKVQEAVKALAAIGREEVDKVRDVLTAEQREKLQALKEERKERRVEGLVERMAHLNELDLTENEVAKIEEIRTEYRPKIARVMEGTRGILSDQQRKAREEGLKAGEKRGKILLSLNLTDEQKEKVEAVGKEVRTLVWEEMEKIRDVLNEEQQAKLPVLKDERRDRIRDRMAARIVNFKDLNLTADQKAKLGDIREVYRPQVHEAGNKLRTAIREELGAIVAVLRG
jgi:Spy/CpxP family protein refolding chaperone